MGNGKEISDIWEETLTRHEGIKRTRLFWAVYNGKVDKVEAAWISSLPDDTHERLQVKVTALDNAYKASLDKGISNSQDKSMDKEGKGI